ncbi:MAG: Flp pilus assembly protein TadD [Parasphingorhabdus sp.]|jgi:Flp pilus assembly protein TadD
MGLEMNVARNSAYNILIILMLLASTTLSEVLADGAGTSSKWDKQPEHLRQSLELLEAEKYLAAVDELTQLLSNREKDADVLNLLGFSHRNLSNFDIALEFYEQALAVDPQHKGALEYLGELYLQTNHPDKAEAQLEKLSDLCTFCKERKKLRKALKRYHSKQS